MSLRWVVVVWGVGLVACGPPTGGQADLDLATQADLSAAADMASPDLASPDLSVPRDLSSSDLRSSDMAVIYTDGGSMAHAFGGCDTRSVNHVCTDFDGYESVVSVYQSTCTAWYAGGCPVADRVGGCRNYDFSLKLTYTNWLYPPNTTPAVMAACPAMFVP